MTRISSWILAALAAASAAGCAVAPPYHPAPPAPPQAAYYPAPAPAPQTEYGQVQSIDLVRAENQTSGAGGVVGGLIGAVVGRQFGSGSGRTAGTLVGAVGGAVIGNQIEKRNQGARDFYRVTIRTQHGQARAFDYAQLAELHVGDRVRIEGNQVYRY
jgi:outer membrane lipoprotein SlyB